MTLSRNSSLQLTETWMSCPNNVFEFPGLAYIYSLNQLIVAKKLDKLHQLIEKHDVSYTIYNNLGEKIFIGVQKNQASQFQIKLYNLYGNEVVQITKYCKCFLSKVYVWAPAKIFAGSIQHSRFSDKYEVKNCQGEVVFLIKKLYPHDTIYTVLSGGEEIGVVMKGWGLYDNYVVSFSPNLGVGMKAVMLGACFLMMQQCCLK
ncbi:phospholipid scramblase 2-like [Leguminivora glycinivorella]|uniref:phospholipid scramblase 2-like n=1 Tax=Leguminivora glycinivorella TaxID=1035111 RepID=UPI00200D5666|nr:phospholipid scramblase 2-like [Leguminivora glycinivorella]